MAELFRTLSFHARTPKQALPGLPAFDPVVAPPGAWPSSYGAAAKGSVLGEPLTTDAWRLAWQVPLSGVGSPRSLLVEGDTVVVRGTEAIGVWGGGGRFVGNVASHRGLFVVDPTAGRLLCEDEEGLSVYVLQDARRDASVVLAFPSAHTTVEAVQGPDVLVFLSVRSSSHGPPPEAVVESFLVRDYFAKSQLDTLLGFAPIGGIVRRGDQEVRMAASKSGPVLATPDGVRFCDWQLGTLADVAYSLVPVALSVDAAGRAYLVGARDGAPRLLVADPGAGVILDVALPYAERSMAPPIVSANGQIALTPAGILMILDAAGGVVFYEERPSRAAATVTSNGVLLVPHHTLEAIPPSGNRFPLWTPPAPLYTPPVIVNGVLYVCTKDTLFALGP